MNAKRDESSPLGYQRSAGARRAGSLRALSSAKNLFIGCQESFFENDCPCSRAGRHLSINSHLLPPPSPSLRAGSSDLLSPSFSPAPCIYFSKSFEARLRDAPSRRSGFFFFYGINSPFHFPVWSTLFLNAAAEFLRVCSSTQKAARLQYSPH